MSFFKNKPFLLYSYLATEMLAPFFASFVIMNCIFFLVKLIPFLDVVLELEIGLADFIRSFAYLFPNMMLYSIPMASMMGIIIGITRLSNDAEILAFKACGISIYHILVPVVLVSLMISIVSAYISINLIPSGEIAMKQLFYQLTKEKINKGIKEKKFTAALGDLVVYVEEINDDTNEWEDVWVSDMRNQRSPAITMAQSGKMSTDLEKMVVNIDLFNGSIHRPEVYQSQIVTFERYSVNIPLSLPATKNTMLGRSAMNMKELSAISEELGKKSKQGRRYLIQYHKRLVLPIGCFIMSLMALPLGLQSGPGRSASGIPLGLGFFVIYYVVYTIGKTLAEDSTLPVNWSMWTPNIIFLLLTAGAIYRVANEKPLFSEKLNNRLITLRQKRAERKQLKLQKTAESEAS